VVEDCRVLASGLCKSVAENGKAVERSFIIDCLSQLDQSTSVGRQPRWVGGSRLERVAENIANQIRLGPVLYRIDVSEGPRRSTA
jgi:hypothetical protein